LLGVYVSSGSALFATAQTVERVGLKCNIKLLQAGKTRQALGEVPVGVNRSSEGAEATGGGDEILSIDLNGVFSPGIGASVAYHPVADAENIHLQSVHRFAINRANGGFW
jgi:hypothetical protein